MNEKSIELIESLIQNKIIELGLMAKDHRNELQEWFFERIRKYSDAQNELKQLKEKGSEMN